MFPSTDDGSLYLKEFGVSCVQRSPLIFNEFSCCCTDFPCTKIYIIIFLFSKQTTTICTVKNARTVIAVLFIYVFVSRVHFIVLTKAQEVDGGWVCWSVYPTVWAKVRITYTSEGWHIFST